jgi:hypothetical protein
VYASRHDHVPAEKLLPLQPDDTAAYLIERNLNVLNSSRLLAHTYQAFLLENRSLFVKAKASHLLEFDGYLQYDSFYLLLSLLICFAL